MKRKVLVSLICLIMAVFMSSNAYSKDVLIGISKIVAHPALDALEKGVQDGIKISFPNAKFDLQNANGEMSTAAQIAHKFKASNVQFGKSLKYFKESDNKQGIANAYGNIGNSYFDIGDYGKSLEYQLLSKDANKNILADSPDENEEYEATNGYTYALHNIGAIYKDIGMYEKALEYETSTTLSATGHCIDRRTCRDDDGPGNDSGFRCGRPVHHIA